MHSPDSPLIRSIAATRNDLESAIRDQIDLLRQPGSAGWEGRLGAAITLPLTGASAVLVGLAHVTLASTDEAEWRKLFGEPEVPVPEEPAPGPI